MKILTAIKNITKRWNAVDCIGIKGREKRKRIIKGKEEKRLNTYSLTIEHPHFHNVL